MYSDDQLIKYVQSGKRDYFRDIVSRYERKVLSVAFKVTGNRKDAEDIAQEVFVQIYRSIGSFRNESSFSTWVYRISMNKALDWKRKHSKEKMEQDITVSEKVVPIQELLPEDLLINKADHEFIIGRINSLPDKYQSVLKLYYFDELSYQEIARKLDIAVKTVESRLYRAKAMLREQFRKEGLG
ncbi:RNA polymerase sigma factor [Bacillus marinisedimentorum]|uniref:RNA polymerase sigma factor n=1 Tax=Bacillus marinisedimentorum TaxID=1821260 RepID=UPI0007DEA855|nr:RNA polymerase sigma factor [Bacillus marinisedimentorum]